MGMVSLDNFPSVQTFDAVPAQAGAWVIPVNNTARVNIRVMARAEDGLSAMWEIIGEVKRGPSPSGNAVGVPAGIVPLYVPRKDLGTELWDVTFQLNASEPGELRVLVTGDPLKRVAWHIDTDILGYRDVL
jgi:hypothetical protein